MDYGAQLKETNPIAYTVIEKAIDDDRAVQTFLFSAPRDYSIEFEPLYLMQRLIGESAANALNRYPDIITIDGSVTGITKEEILLAMERMAQTTLSATGIKILFIKNVEKGNLYSLSALLKFLEEPTASTFIVLTTNHLSNVLQTIKSRSQIITLRGMPREILIHALTKSGIKESEAKLLSTLTGSLSKALALATDENLMSTYKALTHDLEGILRQPLKTYSELGPSMTKERSGLICRLLIAFVNDVWKVSEGLTPQLESAKTVASKYAQNHFDYAAALVSLNHFLIATDETLNFDIARNAFLIAWERCYG